MHKYFKLFAFSVLIGILQTFFLYPFLDNTFLFNNKNKVSAQTVTLFYSSDTWTAPAGVTEVLVECWGAGGGGGSPGNKVYSAGGGGGAYSSATLSVTPLSDYSYTIGTGGAAGTTGGDTYWVDTSTVLAKGGGGGGADTGAGAGGSSTLGVGTTKYSGGSGGEPTASSGGGGGGGAGSGGAGGNASGATAGTGTADYGGNGGAGTGVAGTGNPGSVYGGGGGGTYRSGGPVSGGAGANGLIRITYMPNTSPTVALNTLDAHNFGTDQTPTLEFTGTDTESDRISYYVQIDTVNTFDSVNLLERYSNADLDFENTVTPSDTDPFISGEKIAFTVQEADTLDFNTYYWRVSGKDPSGSNTYGDWSSTQTFIIDAGISIILTTDGTIDYGAITAGGNKSTIDLTDTQTIQNNGSSTINLNISSSNAVGGTVTWTLGLTVGETDVFVHEFSSNAGTDWTKFTTPGVYQLLSSGLAPEGTQNFDLRITVPTLVSDYEVETINISIQGVLP